MSNKQYLGHKNRNHWNVSLWVNNDEGLYNLAKECISSAKDTSWYKHGYSPRESASFLMKERLSASGQFFTPDGAPYSVSSIRAAMVGM
jgi:hypothetical protein